MGDRSDRRGGETTTPAPPAAPEERWIGIGHRADVQGIRGVAVAIILLAHVGLPGAAGGAVGIDLFFVVSGFVITAVLLEELHRSRTISLPTFVAHRARRILPAATVVVAATALACWLWYPVTRLSSALDDALSVLAFVANYRFIREETGYVAAEALPSPFQHFWSLSVEEHFYVGWPLALLAVLLLARRRPTRARHGAIAVGLVILVASYVMSVVVATSSAPTAHYASHTRAWELAAGCLVALLLPTWRSLSPRVAAGAGWLGAGAVAGTVAAYGAWTTFPAWAIAVPVAGSVLVIVAGTTLSSGPVARVLSIAPLLHLGRISYSLYLWHWPLLVLGPLALDRPPSLGLGLLLLAAALPLAHVTYRWVEHPARTSAFLRARARRGIAAGAALSATALAVVLGLTALTAPATSTPVDASTVPRVGDLATLRAELLAGLQTQRVPDDVLPALERIALDGPATYGDGCNLDYADVEPPGECGYGNPDGPTVVLLGDSHAAQWFPPLRSLAVSRGWHLLNRTKVACTPAAVRIGTTQHAGEYVECRTWRGVVLREIEEIAPDLVIVTGADAAPLLGHGKEGGATEWAAAWVQTVRRLQAAADEVVVLGDTPRTFADLSAPDCLALHRDDVPACVRTSVYAPPARDRREAAHAALAGLAGVEVVDTEPWFCVDGRCPLIARGLQVYRDAHHISTAFAYYLSPVLEDVLPRVGVRRDEPVGQLP
ncbi:acyltransferase family protein [Nocardioides caeni]|uniref:acyltransferase family protein n=1 Tax=Nocardioides caeni TaxID=574700 RepID=UPI0031EA706B